MSIVCLAIKTWGLGIRCYKLLLGLTRIGNILKRTTTKKKFGTSCFHFFFWSNSCFHLSPLFIWDDDNINYWYIWIAFVVGIFNYIYIVLLLAIRNLRWTICINGGDLLVQEIWMNQVDKKQVSIIWNTLLHI